MTKKRAKKYAREAEREEKRNSDYTAEVHETSASDKEQAAFDAGRNYQANQDYNNSGWGWWWIFILCLCCIPIILCPIGFVYWW